MSIVKINPDDLSPAGMNNILDILDVLSDNELTVLERCANIVLTERDIKKNPKIVNDFVMSQLEELDFEELLK